MGYRSEPESDDDAAQGSSVVPPATYEYYGGNYWNAIHPVESELRRRATDVPGQSWALKLAEWNSVPFHKALSLNCGNGWVERELVSVGAVKSAVGVDVSARSLADALRLTSRDRVRVLSSII